MRVNGNPKEARNPKSETLVVRSGDSDFGFLSDFGIRISDFTLWQLADSAFPTGGFAHSAGLEAAWQHGEVRNRAELLTFLETNLRQVGRVALPFVNTAYDEAERVAGLGRDCGAFFFNHGGDRDGPV